MTIDRRTPWVACATVLFCVNYGAADSTVQKVDRLFAAYDKADSPGCVLGVIRDGEFTYKRSYGSASLDLGVRLTEQSVFDMGSISKQFTAASVVLAAEKGYLSLDDDVRKYIPELKHSVTLRQMLHHTSGLPDIGTLLDFSGRNPEDIHALSELLDLVARQNALNFSPGREFLYSNTNYLLLGEVVHRATGIALSRFADENIFKPLGMSHTSFHDDRGVVVSGRAQAYDSGEDGRFRVNWSTNADAVGAGGLMSTVDDLLLWDRNFYSDKLGKGTIVSQMLTRGLLSSGESIGYALGLGISIYRGLPVVEHGGANFGYRTELLRFPEKRFSVACLCNLASIDPERLATQVADIYLEGRFRDGPPPPGGSPASRGVFAGLYRDPISHSVAEVTVVDDGLQVRGTRMQQIGPNLFASLFGRYEARFESLGPGGMRMAFGHSFTTPHVFTQFRPVTPTTEDLAQYAGDYVSDELQATYKVGVKQGALTITINWTELPPFLKPSLHDEFHGPDDLAIVFRRDEANHVVGCDVFTERVRKMTLRRQ